MYIHTNFFILILDFLNHFYENSIFTTIKLFQTIHDHAATDNYRLKIYHALRMLTKLYVMNKCTTCLKIQELGSLSVLIGLPFDIFFVLSGEIHLCLSDDLILFNVHFLLDRMSKITPHV